MKKDPMTGKSGKIRLTSPNHFVAFTDQRDKKDPVKEEPHGVVRLKHETRKRPCGDTKRNTVFTFLGDTETLCDTYTHTLGGTALLFSVSRHSFGFHLLEIREQATHRTRDPLTFSSTTVLY